ncbi:hypothetical protein SARC_05042 [Sphaeroforma arctica JP610]|uniref:Right handed beta helix domain-containing protein n=1 Tax=Sphaeroforma arctica JP610 TaxID=667725 RepID=A0A0L0G3C1_9EUKA|nr:hypothetical protein SARC_05042 [Sphaeroforma arctica JP610]KNC82683.1 hypothetical protein SARC_05042 [Sphaeroforma arctica JP610]|eukprot:XP_014156585.1 hypothetical protein SARC_05042 [Sphaeroforma arctica JP610]
MFVCLQHLIVVVLLVVQAAIAVSAAFDVCECYAKVAIGNKCAESLEAAVKAGGEIHIGGKIQVASPISFDKDIVIIGHLCGDEVAILEATFDGSALLLPTGSVQSIEFQNLELTSASGKYVSALRGLGDENNSGSQTLSLKVYNVKAYDFLSEKAGAVFFLGNAKGVYMDSSSVFTNNRVSSDVDDRYAGGGVIAIINANADSRLIFDSKFIQNSALYPGGSGTMEVSGTFTGNRAVDTGAGARAGALRILNHYPGSVVTLSGRFEENTAEGRSGVMASNTIQSGALLKFTGIFKNNNALDGNGGVFSQWSSQDIRGTVEFSADSVFSGNSASVGGTSIAGTTSGFTLDELDWTGSSTKF